MILLMRKLESFKHIHKVDYLYSKEPVDFEKATTFMKQKIKKIIKHEANQLLWFLEHPSIYTIGKSISTYSKSELNILPHYFTDRGGQITYHGPGQRIVYMLLDLKKILHKKQNIRSFIHLIDIWLVNVFKTLHLNVYFDYKNTGVWLVKNEQKYKIVSLGLKIKHWVSYHGISININPDLSFFKKTTICGVKNINMTSLEKLGVPYYEYNLNSILWNEFVNVFQVTEGIILQDNLMP